MINEEFVLKLIRPYLNSKRELSEYEFFDLFADLTRREHYVIIEILIKHNIEYVDEKEEEAEELNHVDEIVQQHESTDYKNLLHLKNEQLAVIAQNGDVAATMALIEKNKRFIYRIIHRHLQMHPFIGLTDEDLYQEGCIGVIEAIKRYDATLDYFFLTYCGDWVRQKISRSIVNTGFHIRLPVHLYEKVKRVNGYRSHNPTLSMSELISFIVNEEIDAERYMTVEEVMRCLSFSEYYFNTSSLNAFVGEDESTELFELIPDDEISSVEERVLDNVLSYDLSQILNTLTPREERIIRLRYGLDSGTPMTLEEVGNIHNVTRERIRQIEAKALRKLRHPSRSEFIKDYL